MHLEKMKKDYDDLELQNQAGAKKIEAWSKKLSKLMTEQEALNGKCKTLIRERETWRKGSHQCSTSLAPTPPKLERRHQR
jgi:chromosome segregation ATPase